MQYRPSTKEDYLQRINVIIEYINNHLDESIDLEHLAEISGFSPFHFHRIVKAFIGEPLGTYICRVRVETAARLLRYSDLSVQEIAYNVGYNVPSSLSKVFKQFYGISPIQYRNNKNYTIMKPVELRPELEINVDVRDLDVKNVIYVRLVGTYKNLDYCGAWNKLFGYVKAHNLFPKVREYLCVYHDDPKVTEPEKLRTDVCLGIEGEVKPEGEIGVKSIDGGRYAVFTYKGSYENLAAVYDTVYGKWIPECEFKIKNKQGFEIYLNHPDNTKPEDLLTEIYVPIE